MERIALPRLSRDEAPRLVVEVEDLAGPDAKALAQLLGIVTCPFSDTRAFNLECRNSYLCGQEREAVARRRASPSLGGRRPREQCVDAGDEHLHVERLCEHVTHALVIKRVAGPLGRRRQEDHGHAGRSSVAAEQVEDVEPIHAGEPYVKDEEVRGRRRDGIDDESTVGHVLGRHAEALLEHLREQRSRVGIVLDDEDPLHTTKIIARIRKNMRSCVQTEQRHMRGSERKGRASPAG